MEMALPVATRLILQGLRGEADKYRTWYGVCEDEVESKILLELATALEGVATRVEQAGSSVGPRTPASADPAPTVSLQGDEPGSGNKPHPGPEVVRTHPGPVHAAAVELKRLIEPYGPTERIRQVLDDIIKLSR